MKTRNIFFFSLFAIIVFTNSKLQSQNFAPVGATWYFTYLHPMIPPPAIGVSYTKFESLKDTIVNGWNCKKVEFYRKYDCGGNIVNTRICRILYSTSNRVYEIENNQQYLLYDFNKNAGEYWVMPKYNNDTVYVQSVTNIVLTNGQTRRLQHVHKSASTWFFTGDIIENIGFETFLYPYHQQVPCNHGGSRRCYYENGIMVHGEILPCDYSTVGIEKINSTQDKVLVKNPVENNIEIQITDIALLPISKIAVYDNIGKLIYQQNNITNNSFIIDFSGKSNGFYYIKLILNNNQLIIKKIIKK